MNQLDVMILKILAEADRPMGSGRIAELIEERFGEKYSTRSIRYRLQKMEDKGLIRRVRRNDRVVGAEITEWGLTALKIETSSERVGMYLSVIEEMAYRCSFDPDVMKGRVVCNVSVVKREHLDDFLDAVVETYRAGISPSPLVAIKEDLSDHDVEVGEDEVAVLTVCSVTIDGVLINRGIPVTPVCGGLLYLEEGEPLGMQEYIEYEGSTVDPLHVFVAKGMTQVERVLETGTGLVPANVRYVPWAALEDVERVERELEKADIRGIVDVPKVEGEILGIPLPPRSLGIVAYGGLVPVALLEERGISTRTYPTRTLVEYSSLEDARRY
ncbi:MULTISPECIES: DUF128 domain-containing protein [unclassified Methanopyrus]|uniref:DUF128 domain-containing protein n=1 Tax=Methanopyrus sp. SNP6 TaxID=1937005 RepID=UPI0011E5E090|nr:DUF128 domain-containing protein [Methanopyrus sp. SNP6]